MNFKFFKKKFILKFCGICLLILFIKFLSTIDIYYKEKVNIKNDDGSSTLIIKKISHKLWNIDGEHIVDINDDKFYIYVNPGPKNKKNKKTLVILPSYSYFDHNNLKKKYVPHKDFKKLVNELNKKYRTIVVEYYGYNKSDDTKMKRSADNICEEIHTALHLLGIKKYILMPHSISGLYSMQYISKYPEEVEGIIGIDITLPYYFLEEYDSNEKYLEHKFNDGGKKIPESYKNMYNYFWETSKSLEKFKFDQKLPLILFTSTMLINKINEGIKNGSLKTKVIDYLENIITNKNIQNIKILNGTHFLHHSQYKEMYRIISENL